MAVCQEELEDMMELVESGKLFEIERFRDTPPELRRLNDIAFSGDGEPTTFPQFFEAVQMAADVKATWNLPEVKLVLITNATMFHKPQVQSGLALLRSHTGEIWAQ